jgi:hypothetical protein
VISIEKFSSVERLFQVTARVTRYVQILISKVNGNENALTSGKLEREELLRAEKIWTEAIRKCS